MQNLYKVNSKFSCTLAALLIVSSITLVMASGCTVRKRIGGNLTNTPKTAKPATVANKADTLPHRGNAASATVKTDSAGHIADTSRKMVQKNDSFHV